MSITNVRGQDGGVYQPHINKKKLHNTIENEIAQHKKRTFSNIDPLIPKSLLALSSNLEELVAQGAAWQLPNAEGLINRCKRLKTLDIRMTMSKLSSPDLQKIIQANGFIKSLLASNSNLDSSGLNALSAESMECLIARRCSKLSPSDMIDFLQHTPKLKELRLISSLATKEVAETISKYCPNLEVLEFSETEDLSEDSYLKIAQNCPHLKEICVYNAETFSDRAFIEFLENCKGLTKANLRNTQVSDASLEKITNLNRAMEQMNLSDCKITYNGLKKLLEVAKNSLEYLCLDGIEIDQEMIKLLCKYHPPLVSFNFMGILWNGLRPKASVLLETIQKFPYLKEIYIHSFEGIDANALMKILESYPHLKAIYASGEQLNHLAALYELDEMSFHRKFLEERGVNISRLTY
jgi:hypothetical protein